MKTLSARPFCGLPAKALVQRLLKYKLDVLLRGCYDLNENELRRALIKDKMIERWGGDMEQYRHEFISKNEALDVRLEFTIDPGGTFIKKHFHDWIEIVYLIHGDLEFEVNNKVTVLQEGDFIVVNPMTLHSTKCINGNTAILLQIPVFFLEKMVPGIRNYRFRLNMDTEDLKIQTKLGNIRRTLEDLWITYQFQVEGYQFRCYSLILELIYILVHSFSYQVDTKEMKQNQKNLERIQFIMSYVDVHYKYAISIPEIAGELGLNEIYFSRFFKKNMGMTFLEYLNSVRLEKIYCDLLNTDLPIKDIQVKHGFYNDKLFRRMFRETYGCTPREARRMESEKPGKCIKSERVLL